MTLDRNTNHLWGEATSPGRLVAVGAVVGAVTCMVGVGGAMLLAGHPLGASVGLGAFVGMWGGLGFGSMMGGVAWGIRLDATAPSDGAGEAPPSGDRLDPGSG